MIVKLPTMELVTVSVAVIVSLPFVFSFKLLNVRTAASVDVKV